MKSFSFIAAIGFSSMAAVAQLPNNTTNVWKETKARDGGEYYDAKTVETIRGRVLAIQEVTPLSGLDRDIHLRVTTNEGSLPVHLGPSSFVGAQKAQLREGDEIEITGSRILMNGKPAIVARTIKKGGDTISFRDESGNPLWAPRPEK